MKPDELKAPANDPAEAALTDTQPSGEAVAKPVWMSEFLTKAIAVSGLLLGLVNSCVALSNQSLDKQREVDALEYRVRTILAGTEGARFIPGEVVLTAVDRRRLEQAKVLIADILRIDKESTVGLALRGIYFAKREMYDKAMGDFEAALAEDDRNADALNGIGQILLRRKDYGAAGGYFRSAIEADPLKIAAYANWGKALAMEGRLEDARIVLERGLLANGASAPILLNLGNVYFESEKYDYAAMMYRSCLEVDNTFELARRNMEIAMRRLEKETPARDTAEGDSDRIVVSAQ